MPKKQDPSWNLRETPDGYLPADEEAYERQCSQWRKRDWWRWLQTKLLFPFTAIRVEDSYEAYFAEGVEEETFRLGHRIKVLSLETESEDGILVTVEEAGTTATVPLADMQVDSKTNPNYWPVREYVVWFANREDR